MDFSKTFEVVSQVNPSVKFTFRRLTVHQAAIVRLEVIAAVEPHVRAVEKMKADGAIETVIQNYSTVATNASVVPIWIKHTLKHVMIGERKVKPEDWTGDPDTPEDLIEEAYLLGSKGSRMTAEQLGEWLSPGTSSQVARASATSSGVNTASASASTSPETAGDTSQAQ